MEVGITGKANIYMAFLCQEKTSPIERKNVGNFLHPHLTLHLKEGYYKYQVAAPANDRGRIRIDRNGQ